MTKRKRRYTEQMEAEHRVKVALIGIMIFVVFFALMFVK